MFVGRYEVRLDAKNRIIVPQKLRESGSSGQLASQFFLTLGTEDCIFVYTPEGWQKLMEEMGATKAMGDETLRTLQRIVAAHADLRECDSQGRIILNDELQKHAHLTRDIIWVGAVNRAEIWDKEQWLAYNKKHISQLGEKLDIVSRAGLALPERADHPRREPKA